MTAQARLDQAIARGVPVDDVRHLMAHAFVLQGRLDAARDAARADRIPKEHAAYAARMRAAATPDRMLALRDLALAAQLAPNDTLVWSDMARLRSGVGDIGGAIDAADRAVALDPVNVDALVVSGSLLRDRYGLAAALPWYDRALALDPRNLSAMLERAATLGELGRAREMLAQTRIILVAYPGNPQALYLQAVLAARAHDWALARSLIDRARGPKGDRLGGLPGPRLLIGLTDLAQGNAEQAIVVLRALVIEFPENLSLRRLLGRALGASGDDRGVIEVLAGPAERPDADTYTLTMIGRALERLGNRRAAAPYLDRASQPRRGAASLLSGSDRRPLNDGLSVPWLRQRLRLGATGDAVAQAQTFLRDNRGSPAAMILLGDTIGATEQWRAAADLYRRAANLKFDEETALRLVDALRRSGDEGAALGVIETFAAQNPRSLNAHLLLSDVALARRDWRRASVLLAAVRLQTGDRDATLLNNLGWVRIGAKRKADAAALGRAAYAIAPNNAPVVANYGWFVAAAGDQAMAVALLEKAVALAPDIPAYRARLAQVRRTR